MQAYLGRRCHLPRACLNHQCLNGATCVPTGETFGGQTLRQKLSVRATAPLRAYNAYYQKDDEWLEEVVESYIRGEEKYKARKHTARNSSTEGEDNFHHFFLIQNLEHSTESVDESLRKAEENSIKQMLQGKREVKVDDDKDLQHYRCLCPPGYYGLHCQTGL